MNRRVNITGCVALGMLLWLPFVAATEPPQLAHNPFARPPSEGNLQNEPVATRSGVVRELDLRATLVASSDRLANVGGKTLGPGEQYQGYTLLQVFEDRAVFAKDGARLTIHVKPELEDDDD